LLLFLLIPPFSIFEFRTCFEFRTSNFELAITHPSQLDLYRSPHP
jgi:hypothetical protein